jgi:hypothetical protein
VRAKYSSMQIGEKFTNAYANAFKVRAGPGAISILKKVTVQGKLQSCQIFS